MNEYIFFDASLRSKFAEYAKSIGVACELRDDSLGLVAAVQEDISDELTDKLEDRYDELQEEQSELLTQTEGGLKKLAGFQLELPDGQTCTVPLQPELAKRLLSCFSFEEVQVLFGTVARSVLDPGNKPLCEILRAEK